VWGRMRGGGCPVNVFWSLHNYISFLIKYTRVLHYKCPSADHQERSIHKIVCASQQSIRPAGEAVTLNISGDSTWFYLVLPGSFYKIKQGTLSHLQENTFKNRLALVEHIRVMTSSPKHIRVMMSSPEHIRVMMSSPEHIRVMMSSPERHQSDDVTHSLNQSDDVIA